MAERRSFTSCDTEEEAKAKAKFLNEQYHMATNYPVEVEHYAPGKPHSERWQLTLPEYAMQFTTTINQMTSSLRDFWLGYQAAKKEK